MIGIPKRDFTGSELARLRASCKEIAWVPGAAKASARRLRSADALLLDVGEPAGLPLLKRAPNLQYIGIFGTGFAAVDVRSAKQRGVTVCNVPGYATEAVAEFAVGAVLAHLRDLHRAANRGRAGDLAYQGSTGQELAGLPVGVVGLGQIGGRVAEIASRGFDARIVYWSRRRRPHAERGGVRYLPLDALLRQSAVICLHLELTEATRGILDARRIRLIPKGALLATFSPMGLIAVEPLLARLRRKELHLILDHGDELPPAVRRAMRRLPNCTLYPSLGYATERARERRASAFLSNIDGFLGGRPRNVLSAPTRTAPMRCQRRRDNRFKSNVPE